MKLTRTLAVAVLAVALSSSMLFPERAARAQPHGGAREHTEEMSLAVGETKTLSGKDVKNYSEGVQGIIDTRLTPDGSQFVIVGKKPGSTTLLFIKTDGTQVTYEITVTTRPIAACEREVQQLIEGTPNVRIRRVGARIFLEGFAASDADLKRIQQVATVCPGQIESLVTLGTTPLDRKTLIRIDFFFVQYDRTSSYQVGIGWPASIGGIANNQPIFQSTYSFDFAAKTTTSAQATVLNQPLPQLDIASKNGWAKVMRQASVLTSNGAEAQFVSGGQKNVIVTIGLGATLQQVKFGVDMTVLPRYDQQNREIEMNLKAEIADLTPPISQNIPSQDQTKLNTLITLKLGQALVLSGIRSRFQRHDVSGLPLLSEIPVLGILFGSHHNEAEDVEGAIFIIPSVIETVPKSAIEVIKNALSQFKDYSGEIDQVDSFNKTPPAAR
jgi:pilus assembly protein CpaC